MTEEGLCLAVFLFRQWSLDYGNSVGWEIRDVSERYYLGTVWIKSESMGLFDASIYIYFPSILNALVAVVAKEYVLHYLKKK